MLEITSIEIQNSDKIESKNVESSHSQNVQNPWPHIDDYFKFNTKEGDNLIFICKLCHPKRVLAKAHKTSLSNLKQHIRRTHNSQLKNFQESIKSCNSLKRKLSTTSTNFVSSNVKSDVKIEEQQSPWPHLDDYFMFISSDVNKFVFNCKLCLPKNVLINGHRTSLNNLKQHINRAHPTYSIPFLETVKEGSCRGKSKNKSVCNNFNTRKKEIKNEDKIDANNEIKNATEDNISFKKDDHLIVSTSNSMVVVTRGETETVFNNKIQKQDHIDNPWPRLKDFFWLESRDGDKYVFTCRICIPKNVLIKAHRSTLSNLKQHIRRTHPIHFKEFLGKIKKGRKNKARKKLYSDASSDEKNTIPTTLIKSNPSGSEVSQSEVEQSIVDFFVSNLLPHSAVESETFEKLIHTLNPTKHSISRRTLGRRISNRQHDGLKHHLIRILSDIKWLSVCIDCCFVHKKNYMGMTVHWIDPSNRKMHSAVLSCIHFTGQHNYIQLLNCMHNIQRDFGIDEKITRITIGENFMKTNFPLDIPMQIQAQTSVDSSVTALLKGCVDEQELQYITLSNHLVDNNTFNHLNSPPHITNNNHINFSNHNQLTYVNTNNNHHPITYPNSHSNQTQLIRLNQPSQIQTTNHTNYTNHNNHINHTNHYSNITNITPPNIDHYSNLHSVNNKHLTCGAYILNMVASEDAQTALQFNAAYISALSKARSLWNIQDSSHNAVDNIHAQLTEKLLAPDTSRWTSSYEAVVVLNGVLECKRSCLYDVMMHLKVSPFDDQDVYFLKEYSVTMSPIAKALDELQREDQAYLGNLLPTIAATIFRLNDIKSQGLVYCSSLLDSLLIGIYKRFEALLEDSYCQLASAFHPRFRLIWLEKFNNTKMESVRKMMEDEVVEWMRNNPTTTSSSSSSSSCPAQHQDDDFFSIVTQDNNSNNSKNNNTAHKLVSTWLDAPSNDLLTDAAFLGEEVLVQLFLRFNTATSSCASVDRLFSKGTDLLHKKSSLSDDKFDMLIFMKGNMHLMGKIENLKKANKDTKS